jgi:hypothetical protein
MKDHHDAVPAGARTFFESISTNIARLWRSFGTFAHGPAPARFVLADVSVFGRMRAVSSERGALKFLVRVWNTAVFWTWMFNGLRFASGLLLLPMLLRYLSEADLSMHWVFFNYAGFVVAFDAMFSVTIARNVGYAMRGVRDIQSMGIGAIADQSGRPNVVLLGQLLAATKYIYRLLSAGILLLLGVAATSSILPLFAQTSNPSIAWAAWVVTILSAALELYTGYWLVFLRGLNAVVLSARLSTGIYALKLLLSGLFLVTGLGLLAVPVSTLITGLLQRFLARYFTRKSLPPGTAQDPSRNAELMRSIWPNAWRLGLILLVFNGMVASFGVVISRGWGLHTYYRYGVSHQVIYSICTNMSSVWTFVKWPMVSQLRAVGDRAALKSVLWPRIWLQLVTFVVLSSGFVLVGDDLLKLVAPTKALLPQAWLWLMALYVLLEMHYSFWTTLISTENRIPSFRASILTNLASIILAVGLMRLTSLGLLSFIIAPLLCGLVFNYWYWPRVGAQSLGTTWWRYMLKGL